MNMTSSKISNRDATRGNLDPATPHTLEVRNLGTSGRPRVDVDAFVVLR